MRCWGESKDEWGATGLSQRQTLLTFKCSLSCIGFANWNFVGLIPSILGCWPWVWKKKNLPVLKKKEQKQNLKQRNISCINLVAMVVKYHHKRKKNERIFFPVWWFCGFRRNRGLLVWESIWNSESEEQKCIHIITLFKCLRITPSLSKIFC